MNEAENTIRYSRSSATGVTPGNPSHVGSSLLVEDCGAGIVHIRLHKNAGNNVIKARRHSIEAPSPTTRRASAQSRAHAPDSARRNGQPSALALDEPASQPRLADVYEEVAKRIAQRLHDESAQMLAVIYMDLADIAKDSPEPASSKLAGVMTHLDLLKEQLRQLSHELRPLVLDQLGLLPALRQLADGVQKRSGLNVDVVGCIPASLSPELETALYRIVQEALSNVVRHACATQVEVTLWMGERTVHCSVSDDGIGFQMSDGRDGAVSGLGLIGINERVVALDGDCKIVSRSGKGTELLVEIPL